MTRKSGNGYDVGYRKPPIKYRFKPGQSGNPKGRATGTKNLGSALAKALHERVAVTENGKRRSISKLEAIVKQLVNKAAGADPKATTMLFNIVHLSETQTSDGKAPPAPPNEADRKVMEQLQERLRNWGRGTRDE